MKPPVSGQTFISVENILMNKSCVYFRLICYSGIARCTCTGLLFSVCRIFCFFQSCIKQKVLDRGFKNITVYKNFIL